MANHYGHYTYTKSKLKRVMMMKMITARLAVALAAFCHISLQANAESLLSINEKNYTVDLPYHAVSSNDKQVADIYKVIGQLVHKNKANVKLECAKRSTCDRIQNLIQQSAYFASKKERHGYADAGWTPPLFSVSYTDKYRIVISR